MTIILMFAITLVVGAAMVLFSYHVFLMCTGQTTKEHLTKDKKKEGDGSKETVV